MRSLGLLSGAALFLAACAGSQEQPLMISDVSVETDLAAVGSRDAVTYWQSLNNDLETAIANQFVGRIDPAGPSITVDVDEISLNSPFMSGATAETARLSGRVELLNPAGTVEAAYDVTATSQDIADFLPAGSNLVSIPPTSREYYQAIVQAFARGVALTLSADAGS
jgi:ABC-type glycerol-3-phosphate transport system substrate-binding protein